MGISFYLRDQERKILEQQNIAYRNLRWCELGNQRFRDQSVAKSYYTQLGVQHVSIDLNGQDGALRVDLDHPIPFYLEDQFDVVTNYGTAEHVNNQYQAFRNIHHLCKSGGLMIHNLPAAQNWPHHCRFRYEERFIQALVRECGYQIVHYEFFNANDYQYPKQMHFVILKKMDHRTFISSEAFSKLEGLEDSGDDARTGDYASAPSCSAIAKLKKFSFSLLKR